jgi:hypothetical protein
MILTPRADAAFAASTVAAPAPAPAPAGIVAQAVRCGSAGNQLPQWPTIMPGPGRRRHSAS